MFYPYAWGEASGSAQLPWLHRFKRNIVNCLLCLKLSLCELPTPAVLISECHVTQGNGKDEKEFTILNLHQITLQESCFAGLSTEDQCQSAGKKRIQAIMKRPISASFIKHRHTFYPCEYYRGAYGNMQILSVCVWSILKRPTIMFPAVLQECGCWDHQ